MRRIAALLVVCLSFAGAGCAEARPEMQDFWHQDLEQGTRVALESGRPMLVVFR